jgi:hypothetical protein
MRRVILLLSRVVMPSEKLLKTSLLPSPSRLRTPARGCTALVRSPIEDLAQRNIELLAGVAGQGAAPPGNMPVGSDKNRPQIVGAGEMSPRLLGVFPVRIRPAAYGQGDMCCDERQQFHRTRIDRNGFERPTSRAPGFPAILEVILGFRETARW